MTLAEFKAWFEGYAEGLEAAPTKAQFDRIKEKVKEINGAPITQTIWLHDYAPHYTPWRYNQPYYAGMSTTMSASLDANLKAPYVTAQENSAFNSINAMYAAGKMDAAVN